MFLINHSKHTMEKTGLQSASEAPSVTPNTLASAPFNQPDADLMLHTADNVHYRVQKLILRCASSFFDEMFAQSNPAPSLGNLCISALRAASSCAGGGRTPFASRADIVLCLLCCGGTDTAKTVHRDERLERRSRFNCLDFLGHFKH